MDPLTLDTAKLGSDASLGHYGPHEWVVLGFVLLVLLIIVLGSKRDS